MQSVSRIERTSGVDNVAILPPVGRRVGEHIDMERPQGAVQIEDHESEPSSVRHFVLKLFTFCCLKMIDLIWLGSGRSGCELGLARPKYQPARGRRSSCGPARSLLSPPEAALLEPMSLEAYVAHASGRLAESFTSLCVRKRETDRQTGGGGAVQATCQSIDIGTSLWLSLLWPWAASASLPVGH